MGHFQVGEWHWVCICVCLCVCVVCASVRERTGKITIRLHFCSTSPIESALCIPNAWSWTVSFGLVVLSINGKILSLLLANLEPTKPNHNAYQAHTYTRRLIHGMLLSFAGLQQTDLTKNCTHELAQPYQHCRNRMQTILLTKSGGARRTHAKTRIIYLPHLDEWFNVIQINLSTSRLSTSRIHYISGVFHSFIASWFNFARMRQCHARTIQLSSQSTELLFMIPNDLSELNRKYEMWFYLLLLLGFSFTEFQIVFFVLWLWKKKKSEKHSCDLAMNEAHIMYVVYTDMPKVLMENHMHSPFLC